MSYLSIRRDILIS